MLKLLLFWQAAGKQREHYVKIYAGRSTYLGDAGGFCDAVHV